MVTADNVNMKDGKDGDLTRHGKGVAGLVPTPHKAQGIPPWLRLRDRGRLTGKPEASVLDATDFDALR